jgi:hypothetical protein
MNLTTSIAVYASVCKEMGLPFRWVHAAESGIGLAA